MNVKRILAIFKKQLKDTFKNKMVFVQFILFPAITLVFVMAMPELEAEMPRFFVTMFATMYAGMVPMVNMAGIITEEKEKNTLRVLLMSNVKPVEYLAGVGGYILILCALGCAVFGLIGGYAGAEFAKFTLILLAGVLGSLLLGGAVGILAKNQMSATSIVLPISLAAAFLPMLSMFNHTFELISKFLYTQQVNYLIGDMHPSNYTWDRFAVIGVNLVLFIALFVMAYKKKSLSD